MTNDGRSSSQWRPMLTLPVSPERDHIQGNAEAPITMLEYGDYECPYCGAAYPIVKQVQERMGDRLRFVFRNFPISTIHPHAEPAAEAAEAAVAQGKFWQTHDILFENQQHLRPQDLLAYAQAIGLDTTRFSKELAEHAHHERIREDFMSGVRSGVNGTPTFFINGIRHDEAWDYETLLNRLEHSLVFR